MIEILAATHEGKRFFNVITDDSLELKTGDAYVFWFEEMQCWFFVFYPPLKLIHSGLIRKKVIYKF